MLRRILPLVAAGVLLVGCGTSVPLQTGSTSTSPGHHPTPSTPAAIAAAMTPQQLAGAVMMAGSRTTLPTRQMTSWVRDRHVGSVLIDYVSAAAPAAVRSQLASAQAAAGGSLIVAVDQEGGLIQRLRAPGFSTIPSAQAQGTWSPADVRRRAYGWGRELAAAGVNLDLAPVVDVVPVGTTSNPPIGDLHRQYGATAAAVAAAASAFADGLWQAKVASCAKHFPGLGRVTGNPDYAGGIVDAVTTQDDPLLAPYTTMIGDHAGFLMVSTALYQRIDPGVPAAFSHHIVTDVLRERFGFKGVVISDDLGKAAQVANIPAGDRAIRFIQAGGDLIIAVNPDHGDAVDPMLDALSARASTDPAFRALLVASVTRILAAKQEMGLPIRQAL